MCRLFLTSSIKCAGGQAICPIQVMCGSERLHCLVSSVVNTGTHSKIIPWECKLHGK